MYSIERFQDVRECGDFVHQIQQPRSGANVTYGIQDINLKGQNLHSNVPS